METLQKLASLQIDWEDVPSPGGSYLSVNVRQNIAYVAIQFPIREDNFLYQGRLGMDLSTDDGYKAAELCALNVLKQINKYIGFEKVLGLNHADIYYQAGPDWDDGPIVANGASDIFVKVLEQAGQHSRGIYGVDKLPRNFSVGITTSFTLWNNIFNPDL